MVPYNIFVIVEYMDSYEAFSLNRFSFCFLFIWMFFCAWSCFHSYCVVYGGLYGAISCACPFQWDGIGVFSIPALLAAAALAENAIKKAWRILQVLKGSASANKIFSKYKRVF
ncbi:hypothetical protein [Methanothermobacter sp. DP]|uniref:hypothetical protein n=1 Tax=Methanothermobacter sp. DP TaxID=2998972 RepID=UPI002AA53843|nr:hypothetical protein [Methanothermobacter sp. DP]